MRRNCYCNHRPEEVYSLTSLHSTDGRGGAGARVHGAHAAAASCHYHDSLPSLPLLRSLEPYLHRHNGWEGGSWSRAELKREQGARKGGRGGGGRIQVER